MNIQEIKTQADRYQRTDNDPYELIYALCEIVEAQQKEIAALKPKRSGWDMEPPPQPTYKVPEPPRQINLANTPRQEIEAFARSQGHLPY